MTQTATDPRRTGVGSVATTLLIGAVGGLGFSLLHLPLAWLIGPLVAVTIAGRFLRWLHVPPRLRDGLIPVIGVLVGGSFTPALMSSATGYWPAMVAAVVYAISIAALGTLYFLIVARFDFRTSLFAAMPGGLGDMIIIGGALGANVGVLALVHTMRIVVIVITLPLVLQLLDVGAFPAQVVRHDEVAQLTLLDAVSILAIAVLGTMLGRLLRFPAPPFLGPLALSIIVHASGLTTVLPPAWLVIVVQIVLGAQIGGRLMEAETIHVSSALRHGLIWGTLLVGFTLLAAFVASLALGFPVASLILGLAPGGMPEMALMTYALGIDVAFVTTLHVTRLLCVYAAAPIAARSVAKRLSVSPEGR